jgi:hypothetical protein
LQEQGRLGEFYESLVVDDDALQRGLSDGSLVLDVRLRDALRALRDSTNGGGRQFALPHDGGNRLTFPRPTVVDEAAYAVDVAALGEADVIRLQRRLDTLEQRLFALERNPGLRLDRNLRRAAKKVLRRKRGGTA